MFLVIKMLMKVKPLHKHHVTGIFSQNLDDTPIDNVNGSVEFDPGDGAPDLALIVQVVKEDVIKCRGSPCMSTIDNLYSI